MNNIELLNTTIDAISAVDASFSDLTWTRLDQLTKPQRSLGRLEELAAQMGAIQKTDHPGIDEMAVVVCAGDHGVVAEGVASFPSEVTVAMVANFAHEGAAVNQIANTVGARVCVYDVGVAGDTSFVEGLNHVRVGAGTANMAQGPAMSRDGAAAAIMAGVDAVSDLSAQGVNLFAIGEMGIGNSTAAAALVSAYTKTPIERCVGRGAGLDDEGLARKTDVINRAFEVNDVCSLAAHGDNLGIVAAVGGYEIAMMAGVVLGCAARGVAVISDGFIAGSAVLVAHALAPASVDYVIFSHRSVEQGHQAMYDYLKATPLFDLDLRLGEGTGAVLAMPFIQAACNVCSNMATFAEAGIVL